MKLDADARLANSAFKGPSCGDEPRSSTAQQLVFREGTFYHPELKFQFPVPTDSKTQNAAQAVIAVSARQDAALQFAMAAAGADSPP